MAQYSIDKSKIVEDQLNMPKKSMMQFKVFDNECYERRTVHTFQMGDVEDPDLYVAQPIHEWQQTELGAWVMKHGRDPTYHVHPDYLNYGYRIVIVAWITPKRWTEYCLKFLDKS